MLALFQIVFFNCRHLKETNCLTCLELGLSHLHERSFNYSHQNSLSSFCNCRNGEIVKFNSHYFLSCSLYLNENPTLLNNITQIYPTNFDGSNSTIIYILLFDERFFLFHNYFHYTIFTFPYITWTERFD